MSALYAETKYWRSGREEGQIFISLLLQEKSNIENNEKNINLVILLLKNINSFSDDCLSLNETSKPD